MKSFIFLTRSFDEKIAVRKSSIESVRVVSDQETEVIFTSGKHFICKELASDILALLGGCEDVPEDGSVR